MTKLLCLLTLMLGMHLQTSAQFSSNDTSMEDRVRYLQADIRSLKANQVAAGNRLMGYTSLFYSGFAMEVVGGFLILTEASRISNTNEKPNALYYAGCGLAIGGSVLQIISHGKIGAAGKYLSGRGFTVPIRSRRGSRTPLTVQR
jgi:hypothetical protein